MSKFDFKDPHNRLIVLLLFLAFIFFLLSSIGRSQEYTTRIGNMFYNSDGSYATKVGNVVYHSSGDISVKVGKTVWHYGNNPSINYWEDCKR